jgi:dTDP-4-amino-4,6-dideoxygalactose transaminase
MSERLAIDGGTPVRTEGFPKWPVYDETEKKQLDAAFHSGEWGGTGNTSIQEFIEKFTDMQKVKHGVAVVNGTMALTVALKAVGVKPGDEVIMPPYTFIASATSALLFGAIPVFVDVEEDTFLIDPEKIEAAITPRTKAIMPVHMYGCPANMTRIREIADKHHLKIVEDAAQAQGAQWENKGMGSLGDIGTFSFQSSKNITAGEGGMVVGDHKEYAEKAWSIANVGRTPNGAWYQHDHIGWNLRLTHIQASLLIAQLSRIEQQMDLREKNAALLSQLLQDVEGIQVLKRDSRITRHAWHLYGLRLLPEITGKMESHTHFVDQVIAEGIPLGVGYPEPLHKNRAILNEIKDSTGTDREFNCPVAERLCGMEAVRLYQNVLLADEQAMYDIAEGIKKVIKTYL